MFVAGCSLLLASAAHAEQPASRPAALTYAAAQARFLDKSDAIDAADAGVRAAQARADATRTLGRPDVDVEAQVLDFQKTLYLPLGSLAPVADAFGIADPLVFRVRRFVSRPIITATMPLYAGGQMDAARAGAGARVLIEEAARSDTAAQGLAQLARAYFGRQLAASARAIRQAAVAGIAAHVAAARALEREQQIAAVQRLQAQAALEEARREAEKADADLAAADIALAGLLRGPVQPTTPLPVDTVPLPPVEQFEAAARANHPALKRLAATARLAGAGMAAERAQLRPTVYALAQYNLDRRDTLVTDPDFIFGVGVKYRLASGMGRRAGLDAARATSAQAQAGLREAEVQVETAVKVAHAQARAARARHALYGSTIAAADEALRVARLSFQALQGTSRDVTDAELAAARVRVEQARAAHDYVEALADLLQASGQPEQLPAYLAPAAVP